MAAKLEELNAEVEEREKTVKSNRQIRCRTILHGCPTASDVLRRSP